LMPEDRVVLVASPSGGQGATTLWCTLLNGAALVPFPVAERGAGGLKQFLGAQEISVCVSSPSGFRNFVNSLGPDDFFPRVRLVRFGSESAAAIDLPAVRKHFPDGCVFLNSLSASETGNVALHRFAQNESIDQGKQPVGRPTLGNEILLEDEN